MYCAITDILQDIPQSEFINLLNDEKINVLSVDLTDTASDIVIRANKIISEASSYIDGIISAGGFPVPLAETPAVIKKVCKDIVIYRLYCRRFPVDTPYREIYLDAIKQLGEIRDGKLTAFTSTAAEVETNGGGIVVNERVSSFNWGGYD